MKLQFAGAENPLYIIREKVLEDIGILHKGNNDDEWLIEIKGDPMPVGITDEMQNFMTHEIDIQTGDRYYMFSDGFADQFGGSDHKRLSAKTICFIDKISSSNVMIIKFLSFPSFVNLSTM